MTAERQQIRVSREWLELLPKLPATGRIVVIGASDSGKTTLCRWLLAKLPANSHPALVDSDIGQSTIGPPACIGWRFAGSIACEFFFIGDTTAAFNPSATLAGTWRAVTDAEAAGASLVVLDTSGYLGGRGGFELKSAKLELLSISCLPQGGQSKSGHGPLHVITLGDSPAIRRLLAAWRLDERLTIHRLPQAEVIQQKTRPQRTEWRRQRFAEQFQGADLRRISLRGYALSGLATASELQAHGLDFNDLEGLLLCFHDSRRRGLCLGLLQRLDLREQQILVRAPQLAESATGIMFGTLKLTAEGVEIGRLT